MKNTILVNDLNNLIITQKERIMQRSKGIHTIQFLVPKIYNEWDMGDFTFMLEFIAPDNEYRTQIIEHELDNYVFNGNEYYLYNFELLSEYTRFSGDIEFCITFTYVNPDTAKTYVRKTDSNSLEIVAIEHWQDIVSDESLGAIDAALVALEAQINSLNATATVFMETKADNLSLTDDQLQLTSGGAPIGDPVTIAVANETDAEDDVADGVRDSVVNLDTIYI